MSEFRDHLHVARAAKAVARFPIDAEQSATAIDAVRTTLNAGPSIRRLVAMSAAAAAAVLLGIALLPMSLERSASAAEQLQKAGDVTRGYRGWVHVKYADRRTTTSRPTTGPTTAPTKSSEHVVHFNTVDNSVVHETLIDGRRYIEMREPARKVWSVYDPESNEVRISEMGDLTAAEFSREQGKFTAVTFDDWLRKWTGLGVKPDSVKQTTEGDFTRFDVAGPQSTRATLWVSSQTGLISKSEFESAGRHDVGEYAYGPPDFHDVFDAGAPRTAKVIDGRPTDSVARVTKRLHDRAVKGYGDAVAVLTHQVVFDAGKGKAHEMTGGTKLFAREGDKLVQASYFLVALPPGPNSQQQRAMGRRPVSWPAPDLKDTLTATRDLLPVELMVVNGDSWPGVAKQDLDGFEWRSRTGVASQNLYFYNVGVLVWPSAEFTMIEIPGTVATLLTDKDRPGLIGVRCEGANDFDPTHRLNLPRTRMTFWIDPARDDMPIETVREDRPTTRGGLTYVTRTEFKEHARLPNGRWYPTRWTGNQTSDDGEPDSNRPVNEWRLGIYPGAKLDADWFERPGKNHVDKLAQPAATRP